MLGLSDRQCLDTVSVSQWLLTFGGVILGVPMTWAPTYDFSTMALEVFSIPDFVDGASLLVLSVGLLFLAVAMSSGRLKKK